MPQKHSGRLAEWTDAQRHEFNLMLARGWKTKHAWLEFQKRYPDAVEYNIQTMYTYCHSPQGEQEYKLAIEEVREEAKTKMYSHRGSRLDALIEVAEKLLYHFRASENITQLTRLATEIRSTMSEIRQEVDPLGLDSHRVQNHFDKLLGGFAQLPQQKQNLILEDSLWLKNSTIPTESN